MLASTSNPFIKQITALHSPKGREKQRRCIAEGVRTINTVINAGWKPEHIYTSGSMYHDAMDQFPTTPITAVTNAVMKKISTASTPSGILAVFPLPGIPDPKLLSSGIVLAGISDPGNMGTLIRTCAAFDKHSVVVIEGCDPYSPKVMQSSAGTIAQVTIFEWTWQELLERKGSVELVCLVPEGGTIPYKINVPECLIVIGSEAHGIPEEYVASCQYKATIPMPGGTESLNAAVAGAIALHAIWFNKE